MQLVFWMRDVVALFLCYFSVVAMPVLLMMQRALSRQPWRLDRMAFVIESNVYYACSALYHEVL